MTQAQLLDAVAAATGESLHTVRRRGFSPLGPGRTGLAPEPSALLLDCPFCGRPVPYPGPARGGEPAPAECLGCDLYYEFDPLEVYAA